MVEQGKTLVDAFVLEPLQAAVGIFWSFAPRLASAILILAIGVAISRLLERFIVKILKLLTLDKIADQIQVSSILVKGGIRRKLSELIGAIAYWVVMLAFVMTALNALDLTIAAELFQEVVGYLPHVIAAVFILTVGVFAAAFLAATVRTAAGNAGIVQAHQLGQLVQAIVIIFAFVVALGQLRIQFVGQAFLIILSGISLGSAIAFGLGCKDLAGRWIGDLIDQVKTRKR